MPDTILHIQSIRALPGADRRRAASGGTRIGKPYLFVICILLLASNPALATVEDDQLVALQDIFILLWYFTIFCAWLSGFARGLQR